MTRAYVQSTLSLSLSLFPDAFRNRVVCVCVVVFLQFEEEELDEGEEEVR